MSTITIEIHDEREQSLLLQLLEKFDSVRIVEKRDNRKNGQAQQATSAPTKRKKLSPEKREVVEAIKEGLREVELHRQGKIKLKSARAFLAELEAETEEKP